MICACRTILAMLCVLCAFSVAACGESFVAEPDATGQEGVVSTASFENPCEDGPLDAPIDGCAPTPLDPTGDPAFDCVRRINQLRWECQCLPPLERWTQGEMCAAEHAAYDAAQMSAHAGFSDGICTPGGFGQNECPGWGDWNSTIDGCLQMMWDEGPGEPFSAHGHYLNMTNPRFTKVACGGSDGWFVQNFE